MLPQTPYNPEKPHEHESINDLPVHSATTQQIFWPVSESRQFTREDAGKVFRDGLKSADVRIPHPEMVIRETLEREASRSVRMMKQLEADRGRKEREAKLATGRNGAVKELDVGRWRYVVKDVNIESRVGEEGRGRHGVGWRYGMPFDDRKRGVVKIPTSVP
jgi:Eukaryotic mitochondrial regulator protein